MFLQFRTDFIDEPRKIPFKFSSVWSWKFITRFSSHPNRRLVYAITVPVLLLLLLLLVLFYFISVPLYVRSFPLSKHIHNSWHINDDAVHHNKWIRAQKLSVSHKQRLQYVYKSFALSVHSECDPYRMNHMRLKSRMKMVSASWYMPHSHHYHHRNEDMFLGARPREWEATEIGQNQEKALRYGTDDS